MSNTPEDGGTANSDRLPASEFAGVFDKTPGLYMVLNPSFTIMAANDAYCSATMTARETIVGRHIFEAFPDNPGDSAANGVENLRTSLLKVLKSRLPDRMNIQKYDIRRHDGSSFVERYWSPLNLPVLGSDGYVKWIVHSVEDVTELMNLRAEFTARRGDAAAQRVLTQLRETERELAAERAENAELRESLRKQAKG
jgi:PAS domain-containing protein